MRARGLGSFIDSPTQEDSEKLIKIHFLWIKSLPPLSPQPRRPNEDQKLSFHGLLLIAFPHQTPPPFFRCHQGEGGNRYRDDSNLMNPSFCRRRKKVEDDMHAISIARREKREEQKSDEFSKRDSVMFPVALDCAKSSLVSCCLVRGPLKFFGINLNKFFSISISGRFR